MKLVRQSYEILEQIIPTRKLDDYSEEHFREEYISNMYKHIEKCGRTCYKSEDKITEGSAKRFIEGLIKSKHLSVLEHGVVYLKLYFLNKEECFNSEILHKYSENKYSKWKRSLIEDKLGPQYVYITTNYRVIIENGWEEDLQYLCEPTDYHEKRYTVLLHSCIHVYKDLTRHRHMSFSIESTRFVNYSKTDRFGEMKFVLPPWVSSDRYEALTGDERIFWRNLEHSEFDYNRLIKKGWQPQQVAEVLPQCTAADVVISGFKTDWEFLMDLRVLDKTGKAHPLVHDVLDPLYDDMANREWIFEYSGD